MMASVQKRLRVAASRYVIHTVHDILVTNYCIIWDMIERYGNRLIRHTYLEAQNE